MGKNKEDLLKIGEQYYSELLSVIKFLHEGINDLIEDNLNKSTLEQVILGEHRCDRLKEHYIKVLFESKRALPFLVEDRYQIITDLDTIADKAEELARLLKVFPFKIYDDIKVLMKSINQTLLNASQTLIELVKLMETDFDGAFQKTFNMETHKRNGREFNYDLLDVVYKKEDKSIRIYLTSKIAVLINDIISWEESISDHLRGLIIKYPRK
ncbi:MAG: DUF47 family protein [Promethearchaeota archaeon]|nr:MAG: DUF47 family protein [Candidatus Lokiarchaeota archaeon]